MPIQKYCWYCGKKLSRERLMITGVWYSSPVFCSEECEKIYDQKYKERLKNNPKFAKKMKITDSVLLFVLVIFIVVPFAALFLTLLGVF